LAEVAVVVEAEEGLATLSVETVEQARLHFLLEKFQLHLEIIIILL
jgi:hypothetical protein